MYAITCFIRWITKDQKVHHIWGLIQLYCCLNAGKVNMQQLQRFGNNDSGHIEAFGMNAFMLDALLTAANHPLHLSGHAGSPKPVIQQAQCPLLALVSSIVVTSIHGSYSVSLGDHESQNFLQFASRGVAMVKGSLVKH